MTGFTGRSFNFFGKVGKTYNLISSMNHQLSARLKLAQMWNHNGTNMDGIGFMYKSYRVLMELEGDVPHGELHVSTNRLSCGAESSHHPPICRDQLSCKTQACSFLCALQGLLKAA